MAILQRLFGKPGDHKKRFYNQKAKGDSTFLKVVRGQVVKTGNPIRGKEGQIHFVGIPALPRYLVETQWPYLIKVALSWKTAECVVSLQVELRIIFRTVEHRDLLVAGREVIFWSFQELFEKMVLAGFEHIDDWLKDLFIKAVWEDEAVQASFRQYIEDERAIRFLQSLTQALKGLGNSGKFSGQPLSNIAAIEATPLINTLKATATVKY